MRYRKAPILEAVIELRWEAPKSLDNLKVALADPTFNEFGKPKPRVQINASVNVDDNEISHEQKQVGFEVTVRDGSELVFLEEQKFVFVQTAPYDRWEHFSRRAMERIGPTSEILGITEFSRVGLRFVNRVDIPEGTINTDEYVNIKFDGPREDLGLIDEFQMRVVKPTQKEGIHYALVLATTAPPLPDHSSILLDIDVFTRRPVTCPPKLPSF